MIDSLIRLVIETGAVTGECARTFGGGGRIENSGGRVSSYGGHRGRGLRHGVLGKPLYDLPLSHERADHPRRRTPSCTNARTFASFHLSSSSMHKI